MPTLTLSGIELNFPFEPYECQKDYMKCVIDSIIGVTHFLSYISKIVFSRRILFVNFQRKNAILESPTGTGKTLCLLVSSISWLLAAKADMQFSAYQNEINDVNHSDDPVDPKSAFINKSKSIWIQRNRSRFVFVISQQPEY